MGTHLPYPDIGGRGKKSDYSYKYDCIVSKPQVKHSVRSDYFIQWWLYTNQVLIYMEWRASEYRAGRSGRARKRDREKQINKERDRALKSFGNGMGYKIDDWDWTPEYFNNSDKWIKDDINQMG